MGYTGIFGGPGNGECAGDTDDAGFADIADAPLAWHRVVSRQEAVCAVPAETEMVEAQSQVEAGWPGFSALAHSPHVAQPMAPTA